MKFAHFTCTPLIALAILASHTMNVRAQDFTLVVLPDTQYYTNVNPPYTTDGVNFNTTGSSSQGGKVDMFMSQTQWIVDNASAFNIKYVAHVGDMSEHGDVPTRYDSSKSTCSTANSADNFSEWYVSKNALAKLDTAGIPYGVAVGNHDQSPINGGPNPPNSTTTGKYPPTTTTCFNNFFGTSHFSGRSYYKGSYLSGKNNSHWDQFTDDAGNVYIVIYLEYNDDASVDGSAGWKGGHTPCDEGAGHCIFQKIDTGLIPWAANIASTHPTSTVWVVSHYVADTNMPANFGDQGQRMYDALKIYPNVQLLIGGHVPGEGIRQDLYGASNSKLTTLIADYQGRTGGGNGWMRLYNVSKTNNAITAVTYSPYLDPSHLYPASGYPTAAVSLSSHDAFQLQLEFSPRLDVFYRNTADDHLLHFAWTGSSWSAPQDLGGTLASSPTAVSRGANLIDVFYRGADGHLKIRQWIGVSPWTTEADVLVSGSPVLISGTPASAMRGLYVGNVFYRGTDGSLQVLGWNGTTWTVSGSVATGLTSDPSAFSWGPDRIDVVYRTADGSVGHTAWYLPAGGTQFQWATDNLGGSIVGKPSISSRQSGHLDVYGRAASNTVWHDYYPVSGTTTWSGWSQETGVINSEPSSGSWSPDRVDAFFATSSTQLEDLYWDGAWHNVTFPATVNGAPAVTSWSHTF